MPELPEVEVIRRNIAPALVGRTIVRVTTTRPSYFFLTPPRILARALSGRRIESLERHGKYLIAKLDDSSQLLLHLGMTGQLIAAGAKSPRLVSGGRGRVTPSTAFRPDSHTHLGLELSGRGPIIYFSDVRKFGKVAWLAPGGQHERLEKLGVDALLATGETLYKAARRRSTPIKSLLLDQSVLAGVGNIYADEALFLAKVRPTRAARRVKRDECAAIVAAAQKVMLRSIETGGSSISDYVLPNGSDGGYQNERHVYARGGEACKRCGSAIRRVVIATRSTHFCPGCQS
ncbi:MAG TPA: bifunctional DNA-formamidopyrimidine glycosylase/DNA-(apurinic or apyrimidinic site) lyase [Polyangiaceae bacterium]|nr:bifunctional DNA-formamidopyrimidine glycosylase/DNA-(apurinic or apyrimidinic site) lyase [Polyangiaceae bacterium]